MICTTSCTGFFIIFIGMIYFTLKKPYDKHNRFEMLLNDNQKITYEKIKLERRNIYLKGYFLGFFLSILIILYSPKIKKTNMICTIGVVSFVTNYFYYILSPKSDWMVLHLHSTEQKKAWLEIYRTMQYNHHFGFLLGIIALMVLTNGIYTKCKY